MSDAMSNDGWEKLGMQGDPAANRKGSTTGWGEAKSWRFEK